MKARVKANGEIINVIQVGTRTHLYDIENVVFLDNPQGYWERLKHQYAGMAMQGLMAEGQCANISCRDMADLAVNYATALVEKLKEESNGN